MLTLHEYCVQQELTTDLQLPRSAEEPGVTMKYCIILPGSSQKSHRVPESSYSSARCRLRLQH